METATPWLTDICYVLKAAPLPDPEAFETILPLYLVAPKIADLEAVNDRCEEAFRGIGWSGEWVETEVIGAILEAATNVIQAGSAHLAIRIARAHHWCIAAVSGMSTFDVACEAARARHALDPDRIIKERGRGIFLMQVLTDYLAYTRDGSRVYLGFRKPSALTD